MRGRFAPSATRAAREGRAPDFIGLLRRWGGATIVYRRRLIDAPSYTLNHEEVAKALEEGIRFAEGLTPEEALLDAYRLRAWAARVVCRAMRSQLQPARRGRLPPPLRGRGGEGGSRRTRCCRTRDPHPQPLPTRGRGAHRVRRAACNNHPPP